MTRDHGGTDMSTHTLIGAPRLSARPPEAGRVPSGDRLAYSTDEGQT
jgi:hypothetical protein